ncbi:hypothetical protein D0911_17935 [Zhongshania marina]|uniref:HmuY protein n=2 Tax=Zhongshania marina TaxID=2304603 RepID=A0ABX9VY07_9GAMM|nr:hypothetical protein D0911_17935 [Zhongshania marina]
MEFEMTQMKPSIIALLLSFAFLLAACTENLSSKSDDNNTESEGGVTPTLTEPGPGGDQLKFSLSGNVFIAEVDASGNDWVYVDLVNQQQVNPVNPDASDEWHLAHKGAEIKLNGGVSGAPSSGFSSAVYADKTAEGENYPFDSISAAPPAGTVTFHTDEVGDHDGNPLTPAQAIYAMNTYPAADKSPTPIIGGGDHGWYRDSAFGQNITERSNVAYILRTHDCHYFKLKMVSYRSSDDEAGHPTYQFAAISGGTCTPEPEEGTAPLGRADFTTENNISTAQVDASDEENWVYLNLAEQRQVVPVNPSDDSSWDIAIMRTDIKVNGGSSGTANVGIHDMLDADWSAVTAEPADAEYHSDEEDALAFITYPEAVRTAEAACAGINSDFGWYYYSGFCNDGDGVHHISPRNVVYVLRGQDQAIWKLRILNYYGDSGAAGNFEIEYSPLSSN